MRIGSARRLTAAWFVLMLVAVIWPGAVPASRIEPRILGLPFSFAWPALWVALSVPVLWGLDRVESRHRASDTAYRPSPAPGPDMDDSDGTAPASRGPRGP